MTFIKSRLLCGFWLVLGLTLPAYGGINVRIQTPIDGDEISELRDYLEDVLRSEPQSEWVRVAKDELKTLERYSQIDCVLKGNDLTCDLQRFPIVRFIRFSGIPILILEKELKKHIPVQSGQIINEEDPKFKEAIERSKLAIQSFLERQGHFRNTIEATLEPVAGIPASDLYFQVRGGSFLKVRNVAVRGNYPLDPEVIAQPFRQMCANIRYAFEGIFQGTKACYNRDIEREKISDIEESLAGIGYPEAHLSIDKEIILDARGNPRFVDLTANVLLGSRLEYTFEFVDAQYLEASGFERFIRFITAAEFFSRAVSWTSPKSLYPEDQTILINELHEALTFKQSHIVDESQIQASIEALKEVLRSRGYANATVEVGPRQRLPDNGVSILFRISPGIPLPVRTIELLGFDQLTFNDLLEELDLWVKPRSLWNSGHITIQALEHDRALITNFFVRHGFHAATVKPVLQQGSDDLKLSYLIDTGERRIVSRIEFSNDDPKLTQEFLQDWNVCSQMEILRSENKATVTCRPFPFVEKDVEDAQIKLVGLYSQNGYLKANARYHYEIENNAATLFFDFLPQEMHKAKVAELFVDGNIETYRSVIARELGYENIVPGAYFVPLNLEPGLRRLRAYNVFSKLTLDPVENKKDPDFRRLFLELIERPTLGLDFNVTFDSDRLFNIGVDLEEENLFGTLLQIETSLKFGLFIGRESKFGNVLTWPRFFGTPMEIELTAPELLYEKLPSSTTRTLAQRHARLKTALEFNWIFLNILRPSFEFLFRLDQWQYDTIPITSFWDLDGLSLVLQERPTLRAVAKPSLTIGWFDDLFDPRLGYKLRGSLHLSGPGMSSPSVPYTVFDLEATGYASLGPLTFAANLRLKRGVISDPFNNWSVLNEEADFKLLGGIFGPRSYAQDAIGIFGPLRSNGEPVIENGVPVQKLHPGDFSLLSSLEVRFPLVKKLLFGKLNGAVFADLGYVGICDSAFYCFNTIPGQPDPHQLGVSVGAALRFVLPVGPLSVDYAVSPIHTGNGLFGREARLNLQFGYTF